MKQVKLILLSVFLCVFAASCGVDMDKLPGIWQQTKSGDKAVDEKTANFVKFKDGKAITTILGSRTNVVFDYTVDGEVVTLKRSTTVAGKKIVAEFKFEVEDINDETLKIKGTGDDKTSRPESFVGEFKRVSEDDKRIKDKSLNFDITPAPAP